MTQTQTPPPVASDPAEDAMSPADTGLATHEAGAVVGIAREEAEIKAQIYMAKTYPRDEVKVLKQVLATCQHPPPSSGCRNRVRPPDDGGGSWRCGGRWVSPSLRS